MRACSTGVFGSCLRLCAPPSRPLPPLRKRIIASEPLKANMRAGCGKRPRLWPRIVYNGQCVTRCWGTSDARWGCENRGAVQLCELRAPSANGSSVAGDPQDRQRGAEGAVAGIREALCQVRPALDPPEKLLRALLLQAFYSVRSERQLME